MMSNKQGFTLIELLVVVAIIGMLLSVIMVNFGNARIRSRDAKRLSDIHQVKTGLDLFYTSSGGYPDPAIWNSGYLTCAGGQSFMQVPKDLLTGVYYVYATQNATNGCGGTLWRNYYVQFVTESRTDIGDAGTYYLSPLGITTTAPF